MTLQPRGDGAAAASAREDFIANVAADILGKLPLEFDMNRIKKEMGVPGPTQVVLLQELARFNLLVERMRSTLKSCRRRSAARSACPATSTCSPPRSSTASCPRRGQR